MRFLALITTFVSAALIAGCVAPTGPHASRQAITSSEIVHGYELVVNDINAQPLEGAEVSFAATVEGKEGASTTECVTDTKGFCKLDINVLRNPVFRYSKSYGSSVKYSASKAGFYSASGYLSSRYGSDISLAKENPVKESVVLYRPVDYLSEVFVNSASDLDLREQALKFISLIRIQSLLVDLDIVLRSTGTSSFKGKKYFQMNINSTNVFNSLKMDKYAIGKRLFDESIRKILSPLNDNISNPTAFFDYDLTIYGYTKSFAEKYAVSERIEYRFLMPQEVVKRYKDKDISGQDLLDASVILMNDERINLKLQ